LKRKLCFFLYMIVCSILLVSCTQVQQNTTSTTTTTTSTVTKTTTAITSSTPSDKPQYGGQIIIGYNNNTSDFDEVFGFAGSAGIHPMRLTNEELLVGDWSKGPAGTGETNFGADRDNFKTGSIAESWDLSGFDEGKITFKIRKGIQFALNQNSEASRLVGGRELTADDVVFSLKQQATNARTYLYGAAVPLRTAEITAPDQYTLVIKAAPGTASGWFLRVTDFFRVVPHEVVEKYGDMRDWKNNVGSGPFMFTDFVDNSSMTFIKNPNYWGTNPVGPGKGDKLPYVDGVKILIITDLATRQSAMRTGRIDSIYNIDWESYPVLSKQISNVQYLEGGRSGSTGCTVLRTDKTPFNDIKVRRALFLALDFNSISTSLYGPDPRILTWPIGYWKEYKDAYLGLDDPECPDTVKELYSYNPDKAMELLKEAGYPEGFKSSVVVLSSSETAMDYYTTLVSYWAKVGIDVTIEPREYGVWNSILKSRGYDQIMYGSYSPISNLHQATSMWGDSITNGSFISDPKVEEARTKMMALSFKDNKSADALHKELMKYVLEQAWVIPMPSPVSYAMWQPWLKNYYGNTTIGYINEPNWTQWAWVDNGLKKSLGH
jgi:peptide/nickel transport system substrate-binding protein